jgi:hypothetical protein
MRVQLFVVGILGIAACAGDDGGDDGGDDAPPTVDYTQKCFGDFGAVHRLAELETAEWETDAQLTADQLTIVFDRGIGASARVMTAHRDHVDDPFGEPTALALELGGRSYADHSTITDDGLTIVYRNSLDNGSEVSLQLWTASRASVTDPFENARALDISAVGDTFFHPYLVPDGTGIYYSFTDATHADTVELSSIDGASLSAPVDVALATPAGDVDEFHQPVVSGDGKTIYFVNGTLGNANVAMWRAERDDPSGDFATTESVSLADPEIAFPVPSWISPDGCRAYGYYLDADGAGELFYTDRAE